MRIITRISIVIFLLSGNFCLGQKIDKEAGASSYTNGIGIRAGGAPGISFKHFTGTNIAIEGLLHFRGSDAFLVTGLYEYHSPAFDVDRLRWFYGVGLHLGSYKSGIFEDRKNQLYKTSFITAGIDGILGLEYHFVELPFTLGLDIKPYFDIINPVIGYWDGALTLRYAF